MNLNFLHNEKFQMALIIVCACGILVGIIFAIIAIALNLNDNEKSSKSGKNSKNGKSDKSGKNRKVQVDAMRVQSSKKEVI